MERNKGEAVRAMQLSEMKIQDNDFAGAREMARIAHQLFPEDENISRLLALSEVYYSIFESGESCQTRDTAAGADFEQFVEKVSSPSGTLNDDDDDDDSDEVDDDDSDDDYDYDDDDEDEDDDDDDDYDDNNDYDDHEDDGDDDFVIAPKRLRERQLKSYTEKKEKKAVNGGVSKRVMSHPKRLRHSQFLSVINRMPNTFKAHDSISSMQSSSTTPSSAAQFYDFTSEKSEDKIRVGQVWALYNNGNGMPKTFAQVKRVNVRPNRRDKQAVSSGHFYLRMGLLELFTERKNMVEPVCCGTFKVKRAPPTLFSVTSLSHCIKAKLLGQNTFEIIPRKGEVWAVYKKHNHNTLVTYPNMGKGECLVVEVLEVEHRSTKIVVLEQLNGFKSIFKAPTVQSTKTGVIDVPQQELGRFSHQISAFKHTKVSNSRFVGCWELDPLSVSGYEKDGFPKCFFNCDPASLLNNPDCYRDLDDVKMDERIMNSETHGLSGEFREAEAKPVTGSSSTQTGMKQEIPFPERETSEKVESRVCHFSFFGKDLVDSVKLEASQCVNAVDKGMHITKDGNLTRPKERAIPLLG